VLPPCTWAGQLADGVLFVEFHAVYDDGSRGGRAQVVTDATHHRDDLPLPAHYPTSIILVTFHISFTFRN